MSSREVVYKEIRFDCNELLYLYMFIEDDFARRREAMPGTVRMSPEARAEVVFQYTYCERIYRKVRAALKQSAPDLLRRYEEQL